MEDKTALRRLYVQIRASLGDCRDELSKAICFKCMSLPEYKNGRTVLLYFAMRGEADLSLVAESALKEGKAVAYPRCESGGVMHFHRIESLSQLRAGSFGILEPSEDLPLWDARDEGTVCFVPGLAFDTEGYRLGYGGGYYDRYLSDFCGVSVGVTYGECLRDRLPREGFDIKTDYIITERQVKRTIED